MHFIRRSVGHVRRPCNIVIDHVGDPVGADPYGKPVVHRDVENGPCPVSDGANTVKVHHYFSVGLIFGQIDQIPGIDDASVTPGAADQLPFP